MGGGRRAAGAGRRAPGAGRFTESLGPLPPSHTHTHTHTQDRHPALRGEGTQCSPPAARDSSFPCVCVCVCVSGWVCGWGGSGHRLFANLPAPGARRPAPARTPCLAGPWPRAGPDTPASYLHKIMKQASDCVTGIRLSHRHPSRSQASDCPTGSLQSTGSRLSHRHPTVPQASF